LSIGFFYRVNGRLSNGISAPVFIVFYLDSLLS
jgi:hypothetical protein